MTHHELKEQLQHDQFTDTVSNVLNYASENRQVVVRWSIVALIVLAIIGGAFWYSSYRSSVRQQDLQSAMSVIATPVGAAGQGAKTFPTEDAKNQAAKKALAGVVAKDGGTREGLIAQYYLGTLKAQTGDTKGAESDLRAVADSKSECAPLAKVALAHLYAGENRVADARALLQSIVDKPTDLVSKPQAQIMLAQLDASTNPQQAKKILQSLKGPNQDPAVARAADQLSSQLAQ